MIIYIFLTLIFLIVGIVFSFNKGNYLISGFNTSDDKDKYNSKKLNNIFALFSLISAAVSFIGIFVNKGFYMVGVLFPVIAVGSVITIFLANSICKK